MGNTTPDTRARQDQARMLRLSGMSWQEVADSIDPTSFGPDRRPLYKSAGAARSAARIASARAQGIGTGKGEPTAPPTPEERRTVAYDRYDQLIFAWMERAMDGDELAAQIVIRAQVAQARLHGLNLRPTAAPVENTGGEVDPVDDLSARRAARRGGGATSTGS